MQCTATKAGFPGCNNEDGGPDWPDISEMGTYFPTKLSRKYYPEQSVDLEDCFSAPLQAFTVL